MSFPGSSAKLHPGLVVRSICPRPNGEITRLTRFYALPKRSVEEIGTNETGKREGTGHGYLHDPEVAISHPI